MNPRKIKISSRYVSFIALVALLCLSVLPSRAQEFQFLPDVFPEIRYSDAIAADPNFSGYNYPVHTVTQDLWNDMINNPNWNNNYQFKSVVNTVRVGINHNIKTVTPNYKYKIVIGISGYANSASPTTSTSKEVSFVLEYNKDSLEAYRDQDVFKLDASFHTMDVRLLGVYDISNTTPVLIPRPDIAKNFFIESSVRVQRYDISNYLKLFTNSNYDAQKNELMVTWKHFNSAQMSMSCDYFAILTDEFKPVKYELEWTYVDDYKLNNYNNIVGSTGFANSNGQYSIKYDFRNNSTRIQTYNSSFAIPIVYEHGSVVFRIRTVRPDIDNYGQLIYSDWNLPQSGTINNSSFNFGQHMDPYKCASQCIYLIQNSFEDDKHNWQYSINFAEEGKYKHVLNYFDGAGHGRQTQTKINSDQGYVVAADKIYDFEGRPAIQTLPIPVQSSNLKYKPDLSLAESTNSPYNAELFDFGCLSDVIQPFGSSSLAGRYYSSSNPDQLGMQKFVPDAGGYPFIETIFSSDNTNKVLWQGGAGQHFQRFNNHGTRNTYLRADQYELNRLMGSEAGKFEFYPKQIVTDPNRQSSYSIFNPDGKVVATALLGTAPDNGTIPIVPLDNITPARSVTMDVLANMTQRVGDGLRLAEHSFLPEAGGVNKFHYKGIIPPYASNCNAQFINVEGHYNVSVIDECGNVKASKIGTAGVSNITGSNSVQHFPGDEVSFTLDPDKHTLVKELFFPDTTISRLASQFTDLNTGIGSCYIYQDSFIRRTVDAAVFPCAPTETTSHCDLMKRKMMDELYPGAKYGKYIKGPNGSFFSGSPNSIFTLFNVTSTCMYLRTTNIDINADNQNGPNGGSVDVPFFKLTKSGPSPGFDFPCDQTEERDFTLKFYSDFLGITPIDLTNREIPFTLKIKLEHESQGSSWNMTMPVPQTAFGFQMSYDDIRVKSLYIGPWTPWCSAHLTVTSLSVSATFIDTFYTNTPSTIPMFSGSVLSGPIECSIPVNHYRYQSDCVQLPNITFPSSQPNMYYTGTASNATPQQLINNFNDGIAEALLPFHPEYCKLLMCNDDLDERLASIETYEEAKALGLHDLPQLLSNDPLCQANNPNAPLTAAQLSFFDFDNNTLMAGSNLLRRLDTLSLEQAYCGCDGPGAYMYCKENEYAHQIKHMLMWDDEIRDLYFKKLVANYLGNRNLLKQRLYDGAGVACGPCASDRMTLIAPPVFPAIFSGNTNNLVGDPDVPYWITQTMQEGVNGSQFPNGAPNQLSVEVNSEKLNQCQFQITKIVEGLLSCGLNFTLANNISVSLSSFCNTGSNGSNITPQNVKTALLDNNVVLSDLCSPFLAEYGLFDERKRMDKGNFVNKNKSFYTGLRDFLNRPEIEGALTTASVSGGTNYTNILLNPASNLFDMDLMSALSITNPYIEARAYVKTVPNTAMMYGDYYCLVLKAGTLTDTLYFNRRKLNLLPNDCNTTYSFPVTLSGGNVNELSFSEIHSVLDDDAVLSPAEGYIADNLVFAKLNGFVDFATSTNYHLPACDNYAIWSHSIPMLKKKNPDAPEDCIHCVEIKDAVANYFSDAPSFGLPLYTNHPMYEKAMSNYLNYNLKKNHTFEEYERLMEGCALSDKIAFRNARSSIQQTFTGSNSLANCNQFLTNLATSFQNISANSFIYKNGLGNHILSLDFNAVTAGALSAFTNYVLFYGPTHPSAGIIGTQYMPISDAKVAQVFLKSGSCTPNFGSLANVAVASETPVELPSINGTYSSYTIYELTTTNPLATPFEIAEAISNVKAYLQQNANCQVGHIRYEHQLLRSEDYTNPDKQAYLSYIYTLGTNGLTHDDIRDRMAPTQLQANAGISNIANAEMVSYNDTWCDNVMEDVYYGNQPSTAHVGWDKLTIMLERVKSALGSSLLFPTNNITTAGTAGLGNLGTSLNVIKMSNGWAWYRLFNQENKLFNVYLMPSPKMANAPNTYQMVPGSLKALPGADSLYRFKVDMQKNIPALGTTHVVTCYGYTDFALGTGSKLDNVVLYDNQNNPGCFDSFTCEREVLVTAIQQGKILHAAYIDSIKRSHIYAMRQFFPSATIDTLMFTIQKQQYQYTLYYYDLAGNLNRTVPPAGVDTLSPANAAMVDNIRNLNQLGMVPAHKKVSSYKYNSFNQLIWQQTPDADISEFFYDIAGRLVFSQNAKQKPLKKYSYTLYDDQSRIEETGSVTFTAIEYQSTAEPHPNLVKNAYKIATAVIEDQVRTKPREDVVATFYDEPLLVLTSNPGMSAQENLRKRVSSILYAPFLAMNSTAEAFYAYGSHFSYDALGNVSILTQDNPYLDYIGQRFKRVDYDYDLLSGKVNMVSYNRGRADQFYQKYEYDADNRITKAFSSKDALLWDRDAAYEYYKHGPLAQMHLGELKVQSLQYAYTIQGWLKAINGDILNPERDMGRDGVDGGLFPKDVFTHALDYHQGDYQAIGSTAVTLTAPISKSLYNGNIARQTTGINSLDNLQRTYQYDQLNRLKSAEYAKVANDLTHAVTSMANAFKNTYSYDNDGNIKTLDRYDGNGQAFDQMTYQYINPAIHNKLGYITDMAPNQGNDLPQGQTGGNYQYDAIGNLVKDVQGGIGDVRWNQYGKVTDMEIPSKSMLIHYDYDGTGNRVRKDVAKLDNVGNGLRESDVYVRDAAGNILAVYKSSSKIDGGLTIDWVNNDIVTHHEGVWTTPSNTGITPFLNGAFATNGSFTMPLFQIAAADYPSWAEEMAQSISLYDYLSLSPSLYSQAFEGVSSYYNSMVEFDPNFISNAFKANPAKFKPILFNLINDNNHVIKNLTVEHLCEHSIEFTRAVMSELKLGADGLPPSDMMVMLLGYLKDASDANNLSRAFVQIANDDEMAAQGITPDNFYFKLIQNNAIITSELLETNLSLAARLESLMRIESDKEQAVSFFSSWIESNQPDWVKDRTSMIDRLNVVYNKDQNYFLNGYLDVIGIAQVNNVLNGISGLTMNGYIHSVLQGVMTGTLNPNYTPPSVVTPDPENLTADTMYLAEHHLYGSSRLGIRQYDKALYRNIYSGEVVNGNVVGLTESGLNTQLPWYHLGFADWIKKDRTTPYSGSVFNLSLDTLREFRTLGSKHYELTDHLGNVLATVMDKKTGYLEVGGIYTGFYANLASVSDYYPFGFEMSERSKQYSWYRSSFNGKEKDDEIYGKGNFQDYGFRMYNTRIARFISVDPLTGKYPWYTPYQFAGNKPTAATDLDGMEEDFGWLINTVKNTYKTALTVYKVTQVGIGLASKVTNFFKDNKFEPYPYAHLSGRLTMGNRYAGEVKKIGGVDINATSVTMIGFDVEFNFSTGKWDGNFNFIGKDGRVITSQGVSVSAPVFAAMGVPVGVGGSIATEQKVGGGYKIETKKSLDAGLGIGPINAKGQYEIENTSSETIRTVKGAAGIAGATGAVGVVEYNLEIGYKLKATSTNND